MDHVPAPALAPLRRWERYGLLALLVVVLAFGVLVEMRSAFLSRRMGDFGVYARAAWAVRSGADLYDVTCDNGWHYNYPPLLAILMVPLADPPAGADTTGMTSFALSVGLWYVFSVLCLIVGMHTLACALEETSADPALRAQPAGCRRWWALRCWPVLICLAPIGLTLMRNQVNLLLLALLCALLAALLRGAHFRAGLYLAAATCVKVLPAFLLVYPLWTRNWRCLAGCGAGLFLGLIAIPLAVFGPARTVAVYEKYATVMLEPALAGGGDDTRSDELLGVNSTWSQAFKAVAHKTLHLDRHTRPTTIARWLEWMHMALGAGLTLLVLLVGRRVVDPSARVALTVGSLLVLMILFCPVCHMHYLVLCVPLVMALLARRWQGRAALSAGAGLMGVFLVFVVANALAQFDELAVLRDVGLPMYSCFLLMGAALFAAWRRPAILAVVQPTTKRRAA